MKTTLLGAAATLAVLCVLSGCAAEPPPPDVRPAQYSPLTTDCIFLTTIDSWKYLDPYHVIIYGPTRSNAYRVELSDYCQVLEHAERIGIASHQNGRLCARDQDGLLVGDQRCSIHSIQPYKAEQPEK